jgi:ankyrin repeat protein
MASTLHYALGYCSYKFINEIENKIDLSTALLRETIRGHTPYHYALECKNTSVGHVIVGGETHEDRDNYGRSPLQMAVQYIHFPNKGGCIRHITMALSAGCNVHHVDNFENNVLHYIAQKNNSHIFYHVLTSNILKTRELSKLLRQRNFMGHTPIMVAATYYSDYNIDMDKFFQNIMASSSDIWENDSEIRIGSGLRYVNSFWKSYLYIRDNLHINIPKQDLKMIIEAIIYNTNISN